MNRFLIAAPQDLQLETNTSCNGKCTFCEYPKMKRHGTAKWSNLIDLMYWYVPKVRHVTPFGMQEPFLEPRLNAILANIKQFNQHAETVVYSNMTVYNEDVMTELIKQQCLDKLCISFYGTTKKAYNTLQPGFDYKQTQQNIKKFMKLRKRLGWRKPLTSLHLLITPETMNDANKFMRKWRPIVDTAGFVRKDSWTGTQQYDPILEMRLWGAPSKERFPCHRLWTSLVIRFDGSVVPCCLDAHNSIPLGNAFNNHDAFNSPELQTIRKMHLEGKQNEISLCKNCSVWRYETPQEWKQYWLTQKIAPTAVTPCI